jgi:hypothetical protein
MLSHCAIPTFCKCFYNQRNDLFHFDITLHFSYGTKCLFSRQTLNGGFTVLSTVEVGKTAVGTDGLEHSTTVSV